MTDADRAFDSGAYGTDKVEGGCFALYERMLAPLADRDVVLLEIGIDRGESLRLWRDFFPRGTIVGVDRDAFDVDLGGRVRTYRGAQDDAAFLTRVARECAPEGFDVIIDDASHVGALSRATFEILFDAHLRPGGVYVVEDWGTGYWPGWPDGEAYRPGHDAGMVGFVKELVDELGMNDRTRTGPGQPSLTRSRFASLLIGSYMVFVTKSWRPPGGLSGA